VTSRKRLSSEVPPGDQGRWNERGYLADIRTEFSTPTGPILVLS
jgi:hypothetical protein